MKKGYQSVKMRVWRYSEDIVTSSDGSVMATDADGWNGEVTTDVMAD